MGVKIVTNSSLPGSTRTLIAGPDSKDTFAFAIEEGKEFVEVISISRDDAKQLVRLISNMLAPF